MVTSGDSGRRFVALAVTVVLAYGAGPANADFAFGKPINLGPTVNRSAYDESPSISADGLTLYFNSNRPGGQGNFDLWMTTRPAKAEPWGPPENLGSTVNSSARDMGPSISADGLSLYFSSTRPGGFGTEYGDIWVTTRATTDDSWSPPENLGAIVNRPPHVFGPSIAHDKLSLFFGSNWAGGSGGDDIWVTTRATTEDLWQEPVNLGSVVNSFAHEGLPSISADGLALFFSDIVLAPYRPGGQGKADLWMTNRPTIFEPWQTPVNLGPAVNTSDYDFSPSISADGCTLYFMSDRPGGSGLWDLWQVSIAPIVDFNGDGKVDGADILTMVEHWETDDSICDTGPMPWGDGVVDLQDLVVLAGHIGAEVSDPTLTAHWALNETEGPVAKDSAGSKDGTVIGDPAWQPESGMVEGALEFDGQDDMLAADLILDPADGSLSVLAWIKGGAPGQVIVSQADARAGRYEHPGCSWLAIDAVLGTLTTDMVSPEPIPPASGVTVTDGQWHRVALVWNDATQTSALYVDSVEVATYVHPILPKVYGDLQIGAGRSREPSTFFTGLIDDVRIYNRTVHP